MSDDKPSAFVDSTEEILAKADAWLDQVAEVGTPVSAARVVERMRPLIDFLRKERSSRSTCAGIIREQNLQVGQLEHDLGSARAELASLKRQVSRPAVRFGLWLARLWAALGHERKL